MATQMFTPRNMDWKYGGEKEEEEKVKPLPGVTKVQDAGAEPVLPAPVRPAGIRTPVLDYSMGKNTPIPTADVTQPWEKNRRPDYSIREPAVDGTIGSPQRVWPVVNQPLDLNARKGDTQKQLDELKAQRAALVGQAKAEQPKQSSTNQNIPGAQTYNMGVGAYTSNVQKYVPGGDKQPDNTGAYPRHSYQGATATTELSDIDKELKELDWQIREKETHMQTLERTERLLERGKRKAELEQVAEKEDFAKKSRYVSTALEGFWEKATSDYSMGYEDLTYEYINNTPGVRDKVKGLNVASGVLNFPDIIGSTYEEFADNEHDISSKGYEYMKPKEVKIYNYLYRRKGRETAEEYLDLLQEELNERKGGKIADDLEEKTLLQYGYGFYAGVDQFGQGVKNAFNFTDDYIPVSSTQFASRDIREDLYNTGSDIMFGTSWGQVGYDLFNTTGNMLPSIALNIAAPGVGTASMGVSAAGNAYQSMLNEGYTEEQSRAYSTMVGICEVGMEKFLNGIPQMGKSFMSEKVLGNLAKLDNVFGRVAKSKVGQMFFSGFSEAVEEPTQNVVENLLWSAVTGEEIDIQGEELIYDGLLAFMTGGSFKGVDILTNSGKKAGKGAEGDKAALPGEPNTDAAKSERPGMELLEGFDIPKSEVPVKTEEQQQVDAVHREMMGMEDVQPQQEAAAPAQIEAARESVENILPQEQTLPGEQIRPGENDGVKGKDESVGAATRGFSPKYAMIDQYGALPEGENPTRVDQLPARTDDDNRVSLTARTALEAEATPDEFAELIENETVRGGFSYIPVTNNDTVQRAATNIQAEGWERSRGAWERDVRNGQVSADIIATGALLYNHAVNSGDYTAAMDILIDYQQAVRNAGQSVQAARILKTLTPSSRLYMIRRCIERMVEDMHLEREITIDENLARRYQETYDPEEADAILDEIARDVARQIPSTWQERFTALRYLNMLGNFRTQGRNWAGNVTNWALYLAKDELAATVEAIASWLSGGRFERTKVHITDRDTRQAARADYENVADWISGGGRTNDRGNASTDFARRVQENRRIFRFAPMEGYRRATDWAMNNRYFGDAAFGREAYARALAGYLNARGIRTNDLSTVDNATMNAAREYAVRQAQEATFRDNNQVSTFVSNALRGRNTPAWARVIGEAVMPFRKTPANVLVRAEEFSPLGLINSAVDTVRAVRGDISGAELVDSWAKTLTGTGLFVMGYALANMGFLRGGPDEDEDKAEFDKLNGFQDYAIMLPGGINLTIDAFSPTALPLLLGAQMDKVLDGSDLTFADLEGMLSTLADPMIEMSMLSGLDDTIDAIRYADNSLGQFLINAGFNYLTQALGNTLMGQMERSTEESRMTTYIDKDSQIPAWLQRNLGKLSQKIPGWDFQQTEYIDQWGREQDNPKGIANWAYNLFSPSYIDKAEVDSVAQELYRLNEVQTDINVFPQSPETTISYTDSDGNRHENYNLSMEEADQLKRTEGQTKAKLVADLIGSQDYNALSDIQKAEAVKLCYDYARELARGEVLPGYDGMSSWMEGIEGNEADVILQKVVKGTFDDAFSGMTECWKNGKDDSASVEALEEAYQVYKGLDRKTRKKLVEDMNGGAEAYLVARENGISTREFREYYKEHETYYDVEKFTGLVDAGVDADDAWDLGYLLEGLEPEKGYKNVRDVQELEAIANFDGLTRKQKDIAMKMYMPDYDPKDKNPDKTELRYDYARQELGLTAEEYVEVYQAHVDNGKKAEKIAAWMELGYSRSEANQFWRLFGSAGKQKIDVVEWHNDQ